MGSAAGWSKGGGIEAAGGWIFSKMARIKSESGSISFSRFVSDSCVCLKKPLIAVSVDRHFNSVDRYSVSCCRKILIHSSGVFGWALKKTDRKK